MNDSRLSRLLAALLATALLAGCATIPGSTNPRAITDLAAGETAQREIGPRADAPPETIVRDFLKAAATTADDFAAPRKFLVPSGAANWVVPQRAVVVKNIDVIPTERTPDLIKATIRAQATGFFGTDGTFEPTSQSINQNVQLVEVDGQWRIQGLSDVLNAPMLVIDYEEFRAVYRRYVLYFPDPTGRALVPDARWLATPRSRLADALLQLLARGPRSSLVGAVYSPLGTASAVRGTVTDAAGEQRDPGVGVAGVRVDFTGLPRLDPDVGRLLAGQVVWTLSTANVQGPYVITVDGAPLDDQHVAGWNQNDVAAVSPNASSDLAVGLHGVLNGTFVKVSGSQVTPVTGSLGATTAIRTIGLSASGRQVAAVVDSGVRGGPGAGLSVGPYGGASSQVLTANSMTRPSWAPDETTVWTVLDDNRVVRLRQDQTTGVVTPSDVDSGEVAAFAPGPITELRLSRSGVRVAMIAGGKVLVGVVKAKPDGQPAITNLQQVVTDRDLVPSSVDWQSSDELVVGRNTADSPVLTVFPDSGDVAALPSRNLSPPVTMVVAAQSAVYATDSSGVWTLGIGADGGAQYWSQVDRLAGGRANPVLPG